MNRPSLRGRRRVAAGAALVAAASAVAVVAIGSGAPSRANSGGGPAKAAGAATVERRDLVSVDTESGTLSYANARTVYDRLSGTITWLPSVGQVIAPGHPLFYVDNAPVVLFDGAFPAYRDLTAGISAGPDVLELNRDLVRMGFADGQITVNDTWQTGTTYAVERWQGSLGETETGTIRLGRIVFLPGAQRISAVDATLGSTGGSGSGSSGQNAVEPVSRSRGEFVSLTSSGAARRDCGRRGAGTRTRPGCPATGNPGNGPGSGGSGNGAGNGSGGSVAAQLAELRALEALLRAETQALRNSHGGSPSSSGRGGGGSGSGSGASGRGGSGAGGGSAILQTTSTQPVVTVDLDATKQSEATVGARVTVEMPDGSTVAGRITYVSSVAHNSSDSGSGSGSSGSSSATVPVTIKLEGRRRFRGLDQAAVSVSFEQQKATGVLSVPVTALLAVAGGGYAVQEAAAPHALIPVTTGLFAAGFVQISGPGIYAGLQVTDSQG
jgi:hypothetical protein